MDRSGLIKKVKIRMEELTPFDEGLLVSTGAEAVKPLEQYIEELLDESAKDLLLTAPLYLLESYPLTGDISNKVDGVGEIELPADYLRLSYFQMSEWKRPVLIPMDETNPDYIKQFNKYTRGGTSKPVAVIRFDFVKSKHILEYYSVLEEHSIKKAGYIKLVPAELIQDDLVDVLTWLCASKVFQIFNMKDQSQSALQQVSGYYESQTM